MQVTSLKRSDRQYLALTLLLLGGLLTGCGMARDEFIWVLGSHLFIIYSVSIGAVILIQRLHKMAFFLRLVEKVRKPVMVLGGYIAGAGGCVLFIGIPRLFTDPGSEKLTLFLGVMVTIAGIHLCMWARASSAIDKAAHAKVVTLTLGFIVGLAYILGWTGMIGG